MVAHYKHVGTEVAANTSEVADVKARLTKARAAFFALAKKVFSQYIIPENVRLMLFQSLILSILLYGAETWVLTDALESSLNVFYMRCLRRIMRAPRAPVEGYERETDEQVRARAGVSTIEALIQQRRLAYAGSLVRNPLPALGALLQDLAGAKNSWPDFVLQDLRAVHAAMPADLRAALGDPATEAQQWQSFIREAPAAYRSACRRLRTVVSRHTTVPVVCANLLKLAPAEVAMYTCLQCPAEAARVFTSNKALRTHAMRVHGARKLACSYIAGDSSRCPACAKVFPTHKRALDHLEYRAKRCYQKMIEGELEQLPP